MTTIGGTGWLPERPWRAALDRVVAAARVSEPFAPLPLREPWITDQGPFNGCSGFNAAVAAYEITGRHLSPWAAWTLGRLRDGARPGQLANVGVRTSAQLAAMRRNGVPPLDDWRRSVPGFGVHEVPTGMALVHAQRCNLHATPLYLTGRALVERLFAEFEIGRCTGGIVVAVDQGFDRARADLVPAAAGAVRGLHIITLRQAIAVAGKRGIECVNSWGVDHGDRGLVRLSEARIAGAPFAWIARGAS